MTANISATSGSFGSSDLIGSPFGNTDAALVELRDFFAECTALAGRLPDWSFARLQHWYHSCRARDLRAHPEWWRDNAHVWRDRQGRVIGLAVSETGQDVQFALSHPSHLWLEETMLRWLVEAWAPEVSSVTVLAWTDDERRKATLRGLGFQETTEAERHYRYDLGAMSLDYELPEGYVVRGLGGDEGSDEDFTRQAELTCRVFPRSEYDRESHDSLRRSPDYDSRLDIAAIAPSGEHVAIACAMLDQRSGIGDFEPIGTHPDYRGKGLAKAVVFEAFRRMRAMGAHTAVVGTGGEPYPANRFYTALGPAEVRAKIAWVKART